MKTITSHVLSVAVGCIIALVIMRSIISLRIHDIQTANLDSYALIKKISNLGNQDDVIREFGPPIHEPAICPAYFNSPEEESFELLNSDSGYTGYKDIDYENFSVILNTAKDVIGCRLCGITIFFKKMRTAPLSQTK